jgi:type I restriction enzyme R subunit
MLMIDDASAVLEEFEKFWDVEQEKGFSRLCRENGLKDDEVKRVISSYIYDGKKPLREDIVACLVVKPKIRERKRVIADVTGEILGYIERFLDV